MEQQAVKGEVGFVTDTAAINAPRQHDIIESTDEKGNPTAIKRYALSAATPTEMPFEHALKFLRDPGFVVRDAAGKILKPMKNREQTTGVVIPEGFVLAEWDELSKEALYLRCKVAPGSERLHPMKTHKDDLIKFLVAIEKAKVVDRPLGGTREMSRAELDLIEEAA